MDGEMPPLPVRLRAVILTMDHHLAGPVAEAETRLRKMIPGLSLSLHAGSDWERDEAALAATKAAIAEADIIVCGMLFLESQIAPVLPALRARAPHCDAIVGALSAPDVVQLTRLGKFRMDRPQKGPVALLKRLRGKKTRDGAGAGAAQARMLRRLPKLLKYLPGTAQDVRAYFLSMQYWLAGSPENIEGLVGLLIQRYADGPRAFLRDVAPSAPPKDYPDTGLYHPRMSPSVGTKPGKLPLARTKRPAIGLLIMRSYVLAGDTAHYDAVIATLEAKGYRVIPAFASGLDARPAIDAFFTKNGAPTIDALVSLTGFSLVGGPAYNASDKAVEALSDLDVPYIAAHALEFQNLSEWAASPRGLSPVEATMMVAIPELDGATGPIVFGGRTSGGGCEGCVSACSFDASAAGPAMAPCPERIGRLAARVDRLVRLRRKEKKDRRLSIVLFNFPPNAGASGTAAYLDVFASLHHLMTRMKTEGYDVDVPESPEALRHAVVEGNASTYGAEGNVVAHIPRDRIVAEEKRLAEIEGVWGPAPGRHQTDGKHVQILGAQFGNVFIGLQPAFGIEGDPMRLLFEGGHAPTHAFAAFYRYLSGDLASDAVLHFGTHGALEFMPGKQTGPSAKDWAEDLLGDLPHTYFYAGNNPSEATIAKRRAGATTVSYLTPSVTKAGLYRSLADLKGTLDRWRVTAKEQSAERASLRLMAQAQAAALELAETEPAWGPSDDETQLARLMAALTELEDTLIPDGLHIAGEPMALSARKNLLRVINEDAPTPLAQDVVDAIAEGFVPDALPETDRAVAERLLETSRHLEGDAEMSGLLRALDGCFVPPVAGGDVIRNQDILPAGRNIHGFDPFRLPSRFAVADGKAQAERLLATYRADHGRLPQSVAVVLWGTDNLKSEGAQLAQVLALVGAEPRFDHYGRLAGVTLLPLETLGRPRIDVVASLSGIFRDLLPMQTRILAQAARDAALADEPETENFVRKHALAHQAAHGGTLEDAALRVFSNADGAYGANVNQMIDAGCWQDEDELATAYETRKCFAYGADGTPAARPDLLKSVLAHVDTAYQNLESIELGVTTIDHYFDSLGGIAKAVKGARGEDLPVYIGDQTRGDGTVRTLNDQVTLETRTRTLNPVWYEGMLRHGYEGVRTLEAQITNTFGWSATTGHVPEWVYREITETFVLDETMRERLATLNPKASARVADRLLEASDRNYWTPDQACLDALRRFGDDVEDRIEGILPATGATA